MAFPTLSTDALRGRMIETSARVDALTATKASLLAAVTAVIDAHVAEMPEAMRPVFAPCKNSLRDMERIADYRIDRLVKRAERIADELEERRYDRAHAQFDPGFDIDQTAGAA